MAGHAGMQAEVVATNIRALITGEGELGAYEPMPPVIVVPLGPEHGAGRLPGQDGIIDGPSVAQIKGGSLLVEHQTAVFGVREG